MKRKRIKGKIRKREIGSRIIIRIIRRRRVKWIIRLIIRMNIIIKFNKENIKKMKMI